MNPMNSAAGSITKSQSSPSPTAHLSFFRMGDFLTGVRDTLGLMDEPEEFPPYDETPFADADAEMPADAYSAAAAVDAPVDDEGCH